MSLGLLLAVLDSVVVGVRVLYYCCVLHYLALVEFIISGWDNSPLWESFHNLIWTTLGIALVNRCCLYPAL